jgi:hypothetical protein
VSWTGRAHRTCEVAAEVRGEKTGSGSSGSESWGRRGDEGGGGALPAAGPAESGPAQRVDCE